MIVWRGPSRLDGNPVVLIATGFRGSNNPKTGDMIQTWIIRSHIPPHKATKTGQDISVCGDCSKRPTNKAIRLGERGCYVSTWQAPLQIYKTFKAGKYPAFDLEAFRGKPVRFGAYGDPAAVPAEIWESLKSVASNTTGYTHQWRDNDLTAYAMASCDTVQDRIDATSNGYRTFRTKRPGQPIEPGEIACPASKEAGQRTTCINCQLCNGAGPAKDIVINLH